MAEGKVASFRSEIYLGRRYGMTALSDGLYYRMALNPNGLRRVQRKRQNSGVPLAESQAEYFVFIRCGPRSMW